MARDHDHYDEHDHPHGWQRFPDVDDALEPSERQAIAQFDALSDAQQRAYLLGDADRAGARVRASMTALLDARLDALAAAWRGTPRVQTVGGQPTGYRSRTRQAELFFAKFMSKGGQARFYRRAGYSSRSAWLTTAPERRLRTVAKYTAVPGSSRHHWGTDVDLAPVETRPWVYGHNRALCEFIEAHATDYGLSMAYTQGRLRGYEYEPWHLSHLRLGPALHRRFEAVVDLERDLVPVTLDAFDTWARGRLSLRERIAGRATLGIALRRVDLWSYVNGIDRTLVAWHGDISVVG
jgi:hypothetical protein